MHFRVFFLPAREAPSPPHEAPGRRLAAGLDALRSGLPRMPPADTRRKVRELAAKNVRKLILLRETCPT